MSSIRSYSRRAGSLFAVAALVLATITPGLIPSFASAAQLNERSIQLSSSSADADNVSYKLTFTPSASAGALVIDFCSNSPLIEAACTTPDANFTAASAESTDATSVTPTGTNHLVVEKALTATETVITLTKINNPVTVGPLYARLTTYADTTAVAAQYVSPTNVGNAIDEGAVAISITNNINVSGAVLETLTFCVAGPTPDLNPGNEGDYLPTTIGNGCTGTLPAPTLKIGKKTGAVVALDSQVTTGSLYSQISTNAAKGAIVNLKSNTSGCGGLLRAGSGLGGPSNCDIKPALKTGIADSEAKFGAKVIPATANLIGLNDYNASTFVLNYNSVDQSTGVTSTYGDPFFSTDTKPVSNENLEIVFGAAVAPNTPAGLYSAELSLIATGKF